uniref:Uncharacterized protein n=1 Tax=Glossina brevipalpis TaxID=37001 RepID=A0A1A9WVV1_9MUSC
MRKNTKESKQNSNSDSSAATSFILINITGFKSRRFPRLTVCCPPTNGKLIAAFAVLSQMPAANIGTMLYTIVYDFSDASHCESLQFTAILCTILQFTCYSIIDVNIYKCCCSSNSTSSSSSSSSCSSSSSSCSSSSSSSCSSSSSSCSSSSSSNSTSSSSSSISRNSSNSNKYLDNL